MMQHRKYKESAGREQRRDLFGNTKTTGERAEIDKGGTSYSVLEDEKTDEGKIRKLLK